MRFSGNQSQVFAINSNSRDYFLEPVSQTNLNLCQDPTIVTLYRQGNTAPVYNGQVTYYQTKSGGQNGAWELNWNSMFLPDGLDSRQLLFRGPTSLLSQRSHDGIIPGISVSLTHAMTHEQVSNSNPAPRQFAGTIRFQSCTQ